MSSAKRPHSNNTEGEPSSKKPHLDEQISASLPDTKITIGTQTETKTLDSPIYIGRLQPWECWCGDRCEKCGYGWCGTTFEVTWTQGAGPQPIGVKREYCPTMCQKCARELVARDTNIPHNVLKVYQQYGLTD